MSAGRFAGTGPLRASISPRGQAPVEAVLVAGAGTRRPCACRGGRAPRTTASDPRGRCTTSCARRARAVLVRGHVEAGEPDARRPVGHPVARLPVLRPVRETPLIEAELGVADLDLVDDRVAELPAVSWPSTSRLASSEKPVAAGMVLRVAGAKRIEPPPLVPLAHDAVVRRELVVEAAAAHLDRLPCRSA